MPTLPQKTAVDKPVDLDWAAALQAEMRTVVRQAIEHLVGAELAAVLGPPYARGEARLGYRHGSKVRTITCPGQEVHPRVPLELPLPPTAPPNPTGRIIGQPVLGGLHHVYQHQHAA